MDIDLDRVTSFMTSQARLLDRRRLDLLTGRGTAAGVVAALGAYRNDDGGFGWALEPDLRAPESQPAGALHAFEVLAEIGPQTSEFATALCDWLASVTRPDGGLPFALPVADATGTAPWWRDADPTQSSLHITTAVADVAHRVARHDPLVRRHAWLDHATRYCAERIRELDGPVHAMELRFALSFLDAVHDVLPDAPDELRRLARFIPADGVFPVEGGVEGEALRPLDFSPWPDEPRRALFAADTIAADLTRLAGQQQDDGGWTVDFVSQTAAGALEWRGYATVDAIMILRAHQKLA